MHHRGLSGTLIAGDYWECPVNQTTLIHTAIFATSGTARVTEIN